LRPIHRSGESLAVPDRLHAFWCRIPSRPNFGDALTPWLIQRMSGQYPVFVRPEDPRLKYLVVGSILEYAGPRCTVWGSGIMARHDPVSPAARILAVRGPLSRARALECGAECPELFGDPALLLPRLYRSPATRRHGLGVVAHYSDKPRVERRWPASHDLRLIDIQDPIESVIDQIASCEAVASSSLHGLIASHAYGRPALWVKFRDLPNGDDSKFHDYFLSLGLDPPEPQWLDERHVEAADIMRRMPPPPTLPDLNPLWRACPFGCAS
jgi:pyruvyltransferase